MINLQSVIVPMALLAATSANAAEDGTARVNCGEIVGRLKGIHGHFCDFGYTYYADKTKLRPLLQDIGASFLRVGINRDVFRGKTLEDASNPAMYDFSRVDYELGRAHEFGLDMLAIVYLAGRSQYPDGPYDGHRQDLNVAKESIRRTVMHLNEGWASGHHFGIRYWEISNEPDLEVFGPSGWTIEGYARTFAAAAEAIRSRSTSELPLKVGGPALADGLSAFGSGFLKWCSENRVPVDFYSFHGYDGRPEFFAEMVNNIDRLVRQYPEFRDTELILDEWNHGLITDFDAWRKKQTENPASFSMRGFIGELIGNKKYQTPPTAIHNARTIMLLERSPLDKGGHFLLTDDGEVTLGLITCPDSWTPLMTDKKPGALPDNPDYIKQPTYHAHRAFQMLSKTPELTATNTEGYGFDVMVGVDGSHSVTALFVNYTDAQKLMLELSSLPTSNEESEWRWEQLTYDSASSAAGLQKTDAGAFTGAAVKQLIALPKNSIAVVQFQMNTL